MLFTTLQIVPRTLYSSGADLLNLLNQTPPKSKSKSKDSRGGRGTRLPSAADLEAKWQEEEEQKRRKEEEARRIEEERIRKEEEERRAEEERIRLEEEKRVRSLSVRFLCTEKKQNRGKSIDLLN